MIAGRTLAVWIVDLSYARHSFTITPQVITLLVSHRFTLLLDDRLRMNRNLKYCLNTALCTQQQYTVQ